MRILELLPAATLPSQAGQVCTCAVCNTKYAFEKGVVARLAHTVNECVVDEDGERSMKVTVGLYVYHNLQCFTAIMDPEGSTQ